MTDFNPLDHHMVLSVTFPCHRYHFDSGLEPGSSPVKTGVTASAIGWLPNCWALLLWFPW